MKIPENKNSLGSTELVPLSALSRENGKFLTKVNFAPRQ